MLQLGPHTINISGWGCPKREAASSWMNKSFGNHVHHQIMMFGQDAMGYHSWTTESGVEMLAICIADGHGDKHGGREYANKAIQMGLPHIRENSEVIVESTLSSTLGQPTQTVMNKIFTDLDRSITLAEWKHVISCPGSPPHDHPPNAALVGSPMNGGATLTIQILFPHPNMPEKLVSIVSNMGDSPLMSISDDGVVTEKTFCLNADNIEAYQYYLDTVPIDTDPEEIYLGRFNMTTCGSYALPFMGEPCVDNNGIQKGAVRPFTGEKKDGRWVASVNNPILQEVFTKSPGGLLSQISNGGIQTARDAPSFLKAKMLAEQGLGDYPTWNFGNTNCNGRIQCLKGSGIGDIAQKTPHGWTGDKWGWIFDNDGSQYPLVLSKTSVNIVDPTSTLVMGSDGFFDIMPDTTLVTAIENASQSNARGESYAEMIMKSLQNGMYTEAHADNRFRDLFNHLGHQSWDDISLWVIRVESSPIVTYPVPDAGQNIKEELAEALAVAFPGIYHNNANIPSL